MHVPFCICMPLTSPCLYTPLFLEMSNFSSLSLKKKETTQNYSKALENRAFWLAFDERFRCVFSPASCLDEQKACLKKEDAQLPQLRVSELWGDFWMKDGFGPDNSTQIPHCLLANL